MAMPAEPAMPTQEYSSAWKTFSMSRCAMTLPIVARRAPAMTTPVVCTTATIVVPCGASIVGFMPGGVSRRRPGSRSGRWEARKSAKELLPGAKKAPGREPPSRDESMRSPCHELTARGWSGSLSALRGVQARRVELDDAAPVLDLVHRRAERREAAPVKVGDEAVQPCHIVAHVSEGLVAQRAEHAADQTRDVVMVDMGR